MLSGEGNETGLPNNGFLKYIENIKDVNIVHRGVR